MLEDESLRLPSPGSSELSSPPSTPAAAGTKSSPAEESTSPPADHNYGDFSSYYILDGGEEDKVKPPTEKKSVPQKPQAQSKSRPKPRKTHVPQQTQAQHALAQAQRETTFRHDVPQTVRPTPSQPQHPVSQPRPPPPPPPPVLPPLPQVQLVDCDQSSRPDGPPVPDTVQQMIDKLEALSTALTNFGGVPTVPKSPGCQSTFRRLHVFLHVANRFTDGQVAAAKTPKNDNPVDNLLGMFEDEEANDAITDGEDGSRQKSDAVNLDYQLARSGQVDGPLSYGIQFIQNALKSWAEQRLTHQLEVQLKERQVHHFQQTQASKSGHGRPKKSGEADDPERPTPPSQPLPLQVKADSTPEGVAVIAFQQVLESGCLQMNTVLPVQLTRALRHLYMQIDHLINQGSKGEPQWRCMSYSAQLAANRVRVEKWKEAQAKAHEEMAHQQMLAQQHMMQQMGLPLQQHGQMMSTQAQQSQGFELERRRSMLHTAQHPHLSQHLVNPLLLGSQSVGPLNGSGPSSTPTAHQNGSATPVSTRNAADTSYGPHTPSSLTGSNAVTQQQLEAIKMYVPGYMPRSGTQMKFSFAPHNQQALETFGPQAFPKASPQAPTVPNEGPMATSPAHEQAATKPAADGPTPAPAARSTESIGADNGGSRPTSSHAHTAPTHVKQEMSTAATPSQSETNGFTAVTTSAAKKRRRSSSPVNASPAVNAATVVGKRVTVGNNTLDHAGDMASRFPHPGAVVVDH